MTPHISATRAFPDLRTIAFEVTPVAATGTSPGTAVQSAAVGPVAANTAPAASAVSVSGTTQVGQVLTGSYTYADADNDAQGTSTFRWLRDGTTAISGATAQTYTPVAADVGHTVAFEVTPVAVSGTSPGTAVKSTAVGPVVAAPPAHQQTVTGGSTGSTTVASASITGTAGNLYLASISTRANVAVSSVSGLSLTWTRVAAQCGDQGGTRVEVWKGTGTPSASGAVTATLASAPTAAAIAVSRYSGASGTGNTIAANGLGTNGACTGGTTSASYTANVTTAVANTTVYGATAIRSSTHTPGSGYTERAEKIQGTGTSAAGTATEDKTAATAGSTAVNGTLSAATDWAVIGVEVRP